MVCGTMADLREDPGTLRHLARLGRSVVTSDQALAISSQVGAVSYVETAALLSVDETFQLFSMASLAALEARRQTYHQLVEAGPRPASVSVHKVPRIGMLHSFRIRILFLVNPPLKSYFKTM